MGKLIEQFFDVEVMIAVLPTIVQGMWMTLAICAVVVPMGLLGGLLAALGMLGRHRWLRWSTIIFVDFFRAIPPLVLLIFVYAFTTEDKSFQWPPPGFTLPAGGTSPHTPLPPPGVRYLTPRDKKTLSSGMHDLESGRLAYD
mgnify:CR=1 FL=1